MLTGLRLRPQHRQRSVKHLIEDHADTPHPAIANGRESLTVSLIRVLILAVCLAAAWHSPIADQARGQEAEAEPPAPVTMDDPAIATGDLAALVGPTWVAEDIQRRSVIDFLQSHITFNAEGQAHGFGGCNNFTGGYRVEGATLELGPLASTKKACPPAIMNQEASFYAALGETRGYQFENGLLLLLDAQGAPVMRLWRRD
jgi:heat shock protein HslJ